jgi:peptidoglycan/LPS O-acetylase OafA/YrhL
VTDVRAALVTLLAALLTYGIAKLSWKYFEQPQLRRGHDFQYDFVEPKYLQPTESAT